ncbi:MAG: gephyrin-like molybdotransferase Glp [Spirochaetota bacterium]
MSDELLHPDEALRLVVELGREAWRAQGVADLEEVAIADALGRTMPGALASAVDHPPFDKSAMDGFAVAEGSPGSAAPGPWRVVETIAAGAMSVRSLGPGEVARIMTGAPVPGGTSFVQRVEWTGPVEGRDDLVRFTEPERGDNIIRRGENLRVGEELLAPRTLRPGDIGLLASSGFATVRVARRPIVGIVSTGDELASPGTILGPASIYDSNGPQLAAQAGEAGAEARFYGAVPDDEAALAAAFARALGECDVVLMSGGVSMGDFDHVPRILGELGVERLFHRIAMRPGKPTWFGRRGQVAVFGLPGNPLSTFVNFEVFMRPHLAARMGLDWTRPILRLPLGSEISRRGADRVEYLPVRIAMEEGRSVALPLRYHGSSMLSVLAEATGLARLELGVEGVEKGGFVDVGLLRA